MERILKDQATPALRTIAVYLVSLTTGAPVASLTFSGAEIQVNKGGAGWVTALGTLPEDGGTGLGVGNYTYLATLLDTNTAGSLKLKVNKAGCNVYIFESTVYVEPAPTAAAIRDALLAYEYRTGRRKSPRSVRLGAEHVEAFQHLYNYHRPHGALAGKTPAEYLSICRAAEKPQSHMS